MKSPTKNSPARKRVKALKRYLVDGHPFGKLYLNGGWTIDVDGRQVFVLPADKQAKAQMLEQVKAAAEILSVRCAKWCENGIYPDAGFLEGFMLQELPFLSSLNLIPPPKQKGGK